MHIFLQWIKVFDPIENIKRGKVLLKICLEKTKEEQSILANDATKLNPTLNVNLPSSTDLANTEEEQNKNIATLGSTVDDKTRESFSNRTVQTDLSFGDLNYTCNRTGEILVRSNQHLANTFSSEASSPKSLVAENIDKICQPKDFFSLEANDVENALEKLLSEFPEIEGIDRLRESDVSNGNLGSRVRSNNLEEEDDCDSVSLTDHNESDDVIALLNSTSDRKVVDEFFLISDNEHKKTFPDRIHGFEVDQSNFERDGASTSFLTSPNSNAFDNKSTLFPEIPGSHFHTNEYVFPSKRIAANIYNNSMLNIHCAQREFNH